VRRVLLLLALIVALPAGAQVYTYTDADGNTVFTDQPHKGAKRVDLPPSNRLIQTPAPSKPVVVKPPVQGKVMHYQMLRILVPLPDTSVREENGALVVTVTSDPTLQPGHDYQLLLDGKAVGDPGTSPVFSINNVDRGAHQLSAQIVDQQGQVIEQTPQQPFYMQRISLNQKRRIHPCQTADYGVRPECPLADKPADAT